MLNLNCNYITYFSTSSVVQITCSTEVNRVRCNQNLTLTFWEITIVKWRNQADIFVYFSKSTCSQNLDKTLDQYLTLVQEQTLYMYITVIIRDSGFLENFNQKFKYQISKSLLLTSRSQTDLWVVMTETMSQYQSKHHSTYQLLLHLYVDYVTKTCLYNVDPLKPHLYIVKLGFTGVYIIFLISVQKHRLWVLVRTASTRRF